MLLFVFFLTAVLSTVQTEAQIFNCNTSDISYLLVKNCTNAVRLNPERFEYHCGSFKQRTHPLRPNLRLATAARKHAADMAEKEYFDHKSKDGRSFSDRIRNEGYRGSAIGENLAKGYTSAMNAVSAWMCSDAHRRNLLNCRFDEVGTAVNCTTGTCYIVQLYGCSKRDCCNSGTRFEALPGAKEMTTSDGKAQGQNDASSAGQRRRNDRQPRRRRSYPQRQG